MNYMDIAIVVIGAAGLVGVWWLGSSLSWLSKRDEEEVKKHGAVVYNFQAEKKLRQHQIHRKGFGENRFKDKALKKRVESDIDKVIREAEKSFKSDSVD